MTITVSYSVDYMDTNPTKMTFDNINDAHDWIHEEVARRVQHVVDHSPYTLSETDIQDIETNEYTLVSITDGVVTEFICI